MLAQSVTTSSPRFFFRKSRGTGGYGAPFLGVHFYTWAFFVFGIVVLGTAFMLLLGNGNGAVRRTGLGNLAVIVFAAMVLGNGFSTLAECGAGLCPDNPTNYVALDGLFRK